MHLGFWRVREENMKRPTLHAQLRTLRPPAHMKLGVQCFGSGSAGEDIAPDLCEKVGRPLRSPSCVAQNAGNHRHGVSGGPENQVEQLARFCDKQKRGMEPVVGPEGPEGDNPAAFRTTHWSVVLAAGDLSRPDAQVALAELCETYWFPLYAFVRRKGHPPPEAEDLVQEFFARLVTNNYVHQAHQNKGKFRTFLLAALAHFLANEWNRQQTLKRGSGCPLVSWDARTAEERYAREPFHELTPEKLFDRRWAIRLLERVHEQLRKEYVAAGKADQFEALEPCLSGDSLPATSVEVGQCLKMSAGAVKVAVHRMRRTYGELARLEIAQTVGNPQEVDDELHHLFEVLRG